MSFARALPLAALVLPLAAACAGEQKLTVSKTISVHSDTEVATAGSGKYDLLAEPDYAAVKELAQDVEIVAARIRITNPDTNGENRATTGGGTVTVKTATGEVKLSEYSIAVAADSVRELTLSDAGKAAIRAAVLSDAPEFEVTAAGTVDAVPAHFDWKLELDLLVTVGLPRGK